MPPPHVDRIIWEQAHALLDHHRGRDQDEVVSYYPPEMETERDRFAIAYTALDGATYYVGDHDYAFPLYSISKVFTYGVALVDNGREETRRRVGVEPSGDAFNSFIFDERNTRPFNAMVNAGALVAANLVHGRDLEEKVGRVLERLRVYAANPELRVNEDVLAAELDELNDRIAASATSCAAWGYCPATSTRPSAPISRSARWRSRRAILRPWPRRSPTAASIR